MYCRGKAAPVGNKNYVISKRFGSHVSAGETVTVYEVLVRCATVVLQCYDHAVMCTVGEKRHACVDISSQIQGILGVEELYRSRNEGPCASHQTSASFPRKVYQVLNSCSGFTNCAITVWSLLYRSLHGLFLERRHHSLETYMNALMKVVVNGYGSRNVVDAICGFLEVLLF